LGPLETTDFGDLRAGQGAVVTDGKRRAGKSTCRACAYGPCIGVRENHIGSAGVMTVGGRLNGRRCVL